MLNLQLNLDDDSEDRSSVLEQDDEVRPELGGNELREVGFRSLSIGVGGKLDA